MRNARDREKRSGERKQHTNKGQCKTTTKSMYPSDASSAGAFGARDEAAATHLGLLNLLHNFALLNKECADNAATNSASGQNTTVGTGDGLLVLGQSLELAR